MPYVKELNWEASGGGGEVLNPSWQEVENAIRNLDGDSCTEVGLIGPNRDDGCLVIGGGEDNQYIGNIESVGESLWINNPDAPEGRAVVLVASVEYDPPWRHIVNLEQVLVAARAFFHTGRPAALLQWDRNEY